MPLRHILTGDKLTNTLGAINASAPLIWYRCNEVSGSVFNSSGSSAQAATLSGVTLAQEGWLAAQSSALFDGVTSGATLTGSSGGTYIIGTFMCLVYFNQITGVQRMIAKVRADTTVEFFCIVNPSGAIQARHDYSGTDAVGVSANGTVTAGRWVWIGATWNINTACRVFLNGRDVTATPTTPSGTPVGGGLDVTISPTSARIVGLPDEWIYWNRVLTAQEMQSIVNASGLGGQ